MTVATNFVASRARRNEISDSRVNGRMDNRSGRRSYRNRQSHPERQDQPDGDHDDVVANIYFQPFRSGDKQIGKWLANHIIARDDLYLGADVKDLDGFTSRSVFSDAPRFPDFHVFLLALFGDRVIDPSNSADALNISHGILMDSHG